jgi:hypothetical protein
MEATVNGIRNVWRAILNFWFAPTDPTTLGFIRVVTGLLIVYTHLAYCYDLTGFFGKHAWYDLASIDRERREYPHITPPLNGWDDRVHSARLPDPPHRKRAFLAWMRSVTADDASRERGLKLLRDLRSTKDGGTIRSVITYVQQLRSDPAARKAHLDALVNASLRNPVDESVIPPYLKNLPETGPVSRASYRAAIDQFYAGLPADLDERQYVMNFLVELDDPNREATIEFLEDPRNGNAEIDYLAYWNFDKAKTLRTGQPIFSLWFHITDPVEMGLAHGIVLVIMTMFTLGLWTRVTSVLTWLAAVSYIHRTQYILFGMDTMSNILLLYLMVGDSGGAFSLDRVIARYRATRESLRRSGGIDGPTAAFLDSPRPTVSAGLALRLIQVHFCFIYMAAGLSKLKGQTWWNHNAYWETVANPEFTMIQFEWYESMMRSMASIRPLYALIAAGVVIHTFVAEIGLPFLVWTRARPWILIIGFLLHAGIAVFMGLTIFSLLMMIMLLAYLPGAAIRGRLFGSSGDKLAVSFNPGIEIQAAAAARAVAVDTDGAVELKPDSQAKELEIRAGSKSVSGTEAARAVLGKSNFLSWMLWIPGLPGLVTRWLAPKSA